MVDNYIEVRSSETGRITKKLSEALEESFEGNNNYLHLGTHDGSGTGMVANTNQISIDKDSYATRMIRFDDKLMHTNLPKGTTYTSSSGKIILPKGSWLLCTTIKVSVGGSTGANSRTYHKLAINYGDDERHSNSLYHRNSSSASFFSQNILDKSAGSISVSGAVISDGKTAVTISVTSASQNHNDSNNLVITLSKAHIHGYRQLS